MDSRDGDKAQRTWRPGLAGRCSCSGDNDHRTTLTVTTSRELLLEIRSATGLLDDKGLGKRERHEVVQAWETAASSKDVEAMPKGYRRQQW